MPKVKCRRYICLPGFNTPSEEADYRFPVMHLEILNRGSGRSRTSTQQRNLVFTGAFNGGFARVRDLDNLP